MAALPADPNAHIRVLLESAGAALDLIWVLKPVLFS
jgi:hypothetical protein